jgi:hypothetical protein
MTGCFPGRGETETSTPGFLRAKAGSLDWRNALEKAISAFIREPANSLLHASTAAGPVAIVEFEALALEDECANAILLRG